MTIKLDALNRSLPTESPRPALLKALQMEMAVQADRAGSSPTFWMAGAKHFMANSSLASKAYGAFVYNIPGVAIAATVATALAVAANSAINYPNYSLDLEDMMMALGFAVYAPDDLVSTLNRPVSGGLAGFMEARIVRVFKERIKALEELSKSGEDAGPHRSRLQAYRDGLADAKRLHARIEEHLCTLNRARTDALSESSKEQKDASKDLETRYQAGIISQDDYNKARKELRGRGMELTINRLAPMTSVNAPAEYDAKTLLDYYREFTSPPPPKSPEERSPKSQAIRTVMILALTVLVGVALVVALVDLFNRVTAPAVQTLDAGPVVPDPDETPVQATAQKSVQAAAETPAQAAASTPAVGQEQGSGQRPRWLSHVVWRALFFVHDVGSRAGTLPGDECAKLFNYAQTIVDDVGKQGEGLAKWGTGKSDDAWSKAQQGFDADVFAFVGTFRGQVALRCPQALDSAAKLGEINDPKEPVAVF